MADQCEYMIYKTGTRCSIKHRKDEIYCNRHKMMFAREVEIYGPILYGYCVHKYENERIRCNDECSGHPHLCERHRIEYNHIKTTQDVAKAKKILIKKEFDRFYDSTPRPSWKEVVEECVSRGGRKSIAYEIALKYYDKVRDGRKIIFQLYWEYATAENTKPMNPYMVELVADGQNVHTQVVSVQSNKALEILLSHSKEVVGLGVLDYFEGNWVMDKYLKDGDADIYEDMKHWYTTETCIKQGDRLYRKVLNGLFYYISSKPVALQIELLKRAYEECLDSMGLCCQGHIARLCNVLSGFEEGCVVEKSKGEKLQEKMAELAAAELSTDEKKKQANEFMDTLNVAEEDRGAWLEALG